MLYILWSHSVPLTPASCLTACKQMAGGVVSEIVQMALSKSSRNFGKTSQRQAMSIEAPMDIFVCDRQHTQGGC
jgi:hypothetical protein